MSDPIEAQLSAWLDGSMPDDEAAAFARKLETDPALAARAAAWQANDRLIRDAFAPLAAEPLPEGMLTAMGLAEPVPAAPLAAPPAANDNPPWWRRHAVPLGSAVAASLALLLLVIPRGSDDRGGIDLAQALDETPSLTRVRLADGREVRPTLTVRAADGRFCREYELAGSATLACRSAKGWEIIASARAPAPEAGSDFGLAAGADGKGLAPAYARLEASDPLGAAAEAELIARGWQAP